MRLIRDEEKGGKGVWKWGKREIIYLSLRCHHQNDSCIKMGSGESHFNVSLIVREKIARQCHKPQSFWRERRAEMVSNRGPSAYHPNALPLDQTDWRSLLVTTLRASSVVFTWNTHYTAEEDSTLEMLGTGVLGFRFLLFVLYICTVYLHSHA